LRWIERDKRQFRNDRRNNGNISLQKEKLYQRFAFPWRKTLTCVRRKRRDLLFLWRE